ncbi:MAG TPA: InlB B-repeat-containing protein [Methanocorpusculum sp.]|nr:InlB B-repeat-containing protein [Methanocorpusculum sp.]
MESNSGVSSVVGVVLLVALVIISAGIVSVFLITQVTDATYNGPQMSFQLADIEMQNRLYHTGGDSIEWANTKVYFNGKDITNLCVVKNYVNGEDIPIGPSPAHTVSGNDTMSTGQVLLFYDENGVAIPAEAVCIINTDGTKEYVLYRGGLYASGEGARPTVIPTPSATLTPKVTVAPTPVSGGDDYRKLTIHFITLDNVELAADYEGYFEIGDIYSVQVPTVFGYTSYDSSDLTKKIEYVSGKMGDGDVEVYVYYAPEVTVINLKVDENVFYPKNTDVSDPGTETRLPVGKEAIVSGTTQALDYNSSTKELEDTFTPLTMPDTHIYKDIYTAAGYYTEPYGQGVQVLDGGGKTIPGVSGYTDDDGNWIYENTGEELTLYVKWTYILCYCGWEIPSQGDYSTKLQYRPSMDVHLVYGIPHSIVDPYDYTTVNADLRGLSGVKPDYARLFRDGANPENYKNSLFGNKEEHIFSGWMATGTGNLQPIGTVWECVPLGVGFKKYDGTHYIEDDFSKVYVYGYWRYDATAGNEDPGFTFYKVIYNANGGTLPNGYTEQTRYYITRNKDQYSSGHITTIPKPAEDPVRSGYSFKGWYTKDKDGKLSTEYTFTTNVVEKGGTLTLYANWGDSSGSATPTATPTSSSGVKHSVTYNLNDGTYGGTISSGSYSAGTSVTISSAKPTRTHYTFAGWDTVQNGIIRYVPGGTMIMPDHDVTLYAQWIGDSVPVTFDANGGSVSPASKSVSYGSPYGTLPTPSRATVTDAPVVSGGTTTITTTSYIFDGWYTNTVGGTKITETSVVNDTKPQTLYARWVESSSTQIISTGVEGGPGRKTVAESES